MDRHLCQYSQKHEPTKRRIGRTSVSPRKHTDFDTRFYPQNSHGGWYGLKTFFQKSRRLTLPVFRFSRKTITRRFSKTGGVTTGLLVSMAATEQEELWKRKSTIAFTLLGKNKKGSSLHENISPSIPRYKVASETRRFLEAALIEGSKMIEAYLPIDAPSGDYDFIPKPITMEV